MPTEKYSNIILNHNNKLQYNNTKYIKSYQQLLIISDDEIKEGDWWFNFDRNAFNNKESGAIINRPPNCKKIIASYPPLEITKLHKGEVIDDSYPKDFRQYLPQPTQQFIEQYIESYNKGEVITDVLVEYGYFEMNSKANYKGNYDFICPNCKHIDKDLWYSKQPTYCTNCSKLKINPDNTITIKPVKDSWDREEMFKLMDDYQDYLFRTNEPVKTFKEWFNQNL